MSATRSPVEECGRDRPGDGHFPDHLIKGESASIKVPNLPSQAVIAPPIR